jgi:subtilase family serine protease
VSAAPTPCSDLAITGFSTSPSSPIEGHLTTINITVKNQGSCSTFTDFVVQWKQTQFALTGPSTTVGPLAPGASTTASLTYTFPFSGNFLSLVSIDTYNSVSETNEINNLAIKSISVVRATTDLQITGFFVDPNPPVQGELAAGYVQVHNEGNTDAGQFQVAWQPTTSTPALTTTVSGLAAGDTTLVGPIYYNYPSAGFFFSKATVDSTGLIFETNEFNNTSYIGVTVVPALPDLQVTDISFSPASPVAGNNVHVSVTVTNAGYAPTGANFAVSWKPGPFSPTQSQQVGALATGASTVVGFDYVYQFGGVYNTTATADSNNSITELFELNNSDDATLVVQGATADLTITNVTVSPSSPSQGDTTTVTVAIKNQGNDAAGPFVVSWNPDADGLIVPSVGTQTKQVNSLGAGASTNVVFTFVYPQAGNFHTTAEVDAFNTVAETNETNNLFLKDFSVGSDNLDLTVTSFTLSPSNPDRFGTVTATITVKNVGDLPVSWFPVQWLLSTTDTSGPGTWIAGLNPGESKTITLKGIYWYSGTFTTRVTVDSTDIIDETNEGNNSSSKSITVNPLS